MLQLEIRSASPRSFSISAVVHSIAIALLVSIHFAPAEIRNRVWRVALLAPVPEPAPRIAKTAPRPRLFHSVVLAPQRIEPKVVLDAPPAIALPRPALPAAPEIPLIAAAAPPLKTDHLVELRAAPAPPKIALKPAGFSAAETSSAEHSRATASTGAFESAETAHAASTHATVRSGGFSEASATPVETVKPSISSGAFGDTTVAAHTAPARTETRAAAATPVEIQFKPKPVYSAEAQRLRIEGAVDLEIVFEASGKLRVLRVVRGLGHGLDENAMDAARGIRFRPAQAEGRPVDSTAILHIVFELAY